MRKPELELYLHIPFCVRKCAYCDFLSAPADVVAQSEYVYTMIREIRGYEEEYKDTYLVSTIFLGGGTPSLLNEEEIADIFGALCTSFRIAEDAEVTIEANPGTVTPGKLKAWKRAGINRLSIGLQSVKDKELRMLGRIHTFEQFRETYHLAREEGFRNINIDLISAIPGQTEESWRETLMTVAGLEPEHISAYSLIIEEGTPFFEKYGDEKRDSNKSGSGERDGEKHGSEERVGGKHGSEERGSTISEELPDEDTERAIYEMTAHILGQYGYHRYEISNYAKEGFACRHNMGYWERKEYLGIGLGASSLVGHTRFHNTADHVKYRENIQKGLSIREDIEVLSLAEEIEEYLFLGLREMKGISAKRFRETFGQDLFILYREPLERLGKAGLLQIEGDTVRLTERGIHLSNSVFVEFLEPSI